MTPLACPLCSGPFLTIDGTITHAGQLHHIDCYRRGLLKMTLPGDKPLSGAEIDTLRKLARAHPEGVDAGDIPSKAGRADLIDRGYARVPGDGFTYITRAGLIAEAAIPIHPGTPNACSILYAAAWRAAQPKGYRRILTYILETEEGASLRAAGWAVLRNFRGRRC